MTVYQIIGSYRIDIDESFFGSVKRTQQDAIDYLEQQVNDFKDAFWQIKWDGDIKDSNIYVKTVSLIGPDKNYFDAYIQKLEI